MGASDRPDPPAVARLQASAWAGIFVFGIVMAILGAILPSLFERIGFGRGRGRQPLPDDELRHARHVALLRPLVDRFGFKALLAVSALLVAAAFLLLSRAASYGLVLGAAVVLGIGGGGLNGGTNALTSDLHEGDKRGAALNVLGIFFGFGALSIPFLIGTLRDVLGLDRDPAAGDRARPRAVRHLRRPPISQGQTGPGLSPQGGGPDRPQPAPVAFRVHPLLPIGQRVHGRRLDLDLPREDLRVRPGTGGARSGRILGRRHGRTARLEPARPQGREREAHPRQRRAGPRRRGARGLRPVGRCGRGRGGGHRTRLRRDLPDDPGHRRRPFRRVHRDGLQHRHFRRSRRWDAGPGWPERSPRPRACAGGLSSRSSTAP
ncbi:MAG: MFS transporter [Candidatus Moduliflexus flocculans]|nr:MFS transporter [Candidatus Moduliflexus flocculans]